MRITHAILISAAILVVVAGCGRSSQNFGPTSTPPDFATIPPTQPPTSTPDTATVTPSTPEHQYTLHLNGSPVTARRVELPGISVNITPGPSGFTGTFAAGTEVTLTTSLESAHGVGWGGDAAECRDDLVCQIVMDGEKVVTLGVGGTDFLLSELILKGVQRQLRRPSQVQFSFSLRDDQDHAVVLLDSTVQSNTRIFERLRGASPW